MSKLSRSQRLRKLIQPEHMVFVGGGALEPTIEYNRKLDFRGRVAVVNPTRETLCGIPCYRSAADIGDPVDLAFVAVPLASAIDAVSDLASAGVGAAIVNTAGFTETGTEGARLEQRLLEAAGDMPVMGPNCPGMANFLDGAGAMIDNLGVMRFDRGVAVISNGGAFLADISCSDRSIPLSYLIGLGNQANLSISEMMSVVLDDDRVTAVLLYLESFPDCTLFARAAITALQKKIPVVALKCGNSRSGSRAAQSHTASMAGDRVIASALFRKLGVVEVETASEALETLKMFSYAGPLSGSRIAFATSSGTYAVTGADALEQCGFDLPAMSEAAKARVRPHIAPFLKADNPLDIATGQFIADADQEKIFAAFLADDYDLAVQCMSFPAENTWEDESWYRSATVFASVARACDIKPVFLSPTHEGLPKAAREVLIEQGSVPLQGYHDGCLAMAHARDWWARMQRLDPRGIEIPEPLPDLRAHGEPVSEFEAKRLLAAQGVSVPAGREWALRDSVPDGLNYPLVLKILHPSALHKSEIGGVRIGLDDAGQLLQARTDMLENLGRHGVDAARMLVEEQAAGAIAELMVGIRRNPDVGQTLTLALGGTLVELFGDSVTLVMPVTDSEIRDALSSLRLYPLLTGWRGAARADVDQLVESIRQLCRFSELRSGELVELEVNPLAIFSDRAPMALDAVLILATKQVNPS